MNETPKAPAKKPARKPNAKRIAAARKRADEQAKIRRVEAVRARALAKGIIF